MNAVVVKGRPTLIDPQISLLQQKLQQGQRTVDHLKWFNDLSEEMLDTLVGEKPEPVSSSQLGEKFAPLSDLGVVVVPSVYKHADRLGSFGRRNRKMFYYFHSALTDANFPSPTRIVKPGDKLRVQAWKQTVPETTFEERLAFLAQTKSVHTGAQGASLVLEQLFEQLPEGYWCESFDERGRLWRGMIPRIRVYTLRSAEFHLYNPEHAFGDDSALLSFTLVSSAH